MRWAAGDLLPPQVWGFPHTVPPGKPHARQAPHLRDNATPRGLA